MDHAAAEDAQAIINRLLEQHAECDEDEREDLLVLRAAADIMSADSPAPPTKKQGGSRPGRRPNLDRDHAAGHKRLMDDYYGETPIYPAAIFRRRFRMSRRVFDRVLHGAIARDSYFELKRDATGKEGLSPHQKVTSALRMFCYGVAADATDEYVRIGGSTAQESFERLAKAIILEFGDEYLRQPTAEDIARHTRINEKRGFPGMFGSLDCTHWKWKNCPTAWRGMFQDRSGSASIVMEAVATSNLWIWHSYIGTAGSNNDINIVDRSPLILNWLQGHAPAHNFKVNGQDYSMCYLLCDGIYPRWSVFVKTIANPDTDKEKWFAKKQEAVRKDVERCFGVLQARFAVLTVPGRSWSHQKLCDTWKACVILHNMIVEDEELFEEDADPGFELIRVPSAARERMEFDQLLMEMAKIRDANAHNSLQHDLIEHLWELKQQHDAFYDV